VSFNFEQLLKRPRVEKPNEEFELPPPEPVVRPDIPEVGSETPAALPNLIEELYDEAARMQELYQLVVETAEPVEVPVPVQDQPLLGQVITSADYIHHLKDRSPKGKRLRQTFEDGILQQSGCGVSPHWPLLTSGRMLSFQDGLIGAAQALEGGLLAGVEQDIAQDAARKRAEAPSDPSAQINRALIDQSRIYRSKFAQTLGTFATDLSGDVFRCLFAPANLHALTEIRPMLTEIRSTLYLLKQWLCTAMLLRLFEYQKVRDALQTLLDQMLFEMFLQALSLLVERAQSAVIDPLLSKLTGPVMTSHPECDLLAMVGSRAARTLSETIYGSIWSVTNYYNEILSDILRESQNRTRGALDELQVLGERNSIGRWILHLEEAIQMCDQILNSVGSLDRAQEILNRFVRRSLPSTNSALYTRAVNHPEYQDAVQSGFQFRMLQGDSTL
jgi:hypothetical protein